MIETHGLTHINLAVRDPQRSLEFYHAVFGVKESLVTPFAKHPAGTAPDDTRIDTPFYTVNYDFRLRRA